FDGLTKTVYGLLNAGGGVSALLLGYGLTGVAVATLVASITYFLMSYLINRRHRLVAIAVVRPFKLAPYLTVLQSSLPFGVLAILGIIYFRIDTVMLEHMRGPVDVGIYNAAYRLLEV